MITVNDVEEALRRRGYRPGEITPTPITPTVPRLITLPTAPSPKQQYTDIFVCALAKSGVAIKGPVPLTEPVHIPTEDYNKLVDAIIACYNESPSKYPLLKRLGGERSSARMEAKVVLTANKVYEAPPEEKPPKPPPKPSALPLLLVIGIAALASGR